VAATNRFQLTYHALGDIIGSMGQKIRLRRTRTFGVILIAIVGLLNFHIPHFLLEPVAHSDYASRILELALLANLIGGVIAALGVYRVMRWGWMLGVYIASFSIFLYLLQETIGLPGLPQAWSEPSRIASLIVDVLFLVLAWRQLH
jgi:uncharacterized membrane protein YhdT